MGSVSASWPPLPVLKQARQALPGIWIPEAEDSVGLEWDPGIVILDHFNYPQVILTFRQAQEPLL